MLDLSPILSAISAEGWQVRLLAQLSADSWRAVLHRPEEDGIYITPDASGPDPIYALASAYACIVSARFLPYVQPDAHASAPEFTLASLGLAPKLTYSSPLRRKA